MTGKQNVRALVVTPPAPLPPPGDRLRIFLAGSIDGGQAPDWQADVITVLADWRCGHLQPSSRI
ncbi:hypothetical protein FHW94_001819 [Novosphingobium sp. SG720]|nr:hypothetical protein [Novosphingobium sp. SG720]